jgi:hypothetical protein
MSARPIRSHAVDAAIEIVPTTTTADRELERVRTFAKVLDGYGVDPLLGFIVPGLGDLLGSVLGLYIVSIAIRRGVSKVVIARMLLNLGADLLIGVVPFAGDISDFVFKANQRNLRLLEARVENTKSRASDWLVVIGAALAFVAAVGVVVWAMGALIHAIVR